MVSVLAGRDPQLQADMGCRHRPEQAELPMHHFADTGGGLESELHIPGEIAVVADIAGGAMRALRQLVERAFRQLGALAARAKQIPAAFQQPAFHRFQAQLDDMPLVRSPLPGETQWPDVHQVDLLCRNQPVREPAPETVAVTRGVEPDHCCVQTLIMGYVQLHGFGRIWRLGLFFRPVFDPAGDTVEISFGRRKDDFVGKDVADQMPWLDIGTVMHNAPSAGWGVLEADMDIELFQRSFEEEAAVTEPVAGRPFLGNVFPMQGDETNLGHREKANAAIRLKLFPDLMFR